MDGERPLDLGSALPDAVRAISNSSTDRAEQTHRGASDPYTYFASHISRCPRQAYLGTLGLRDVEPEAIGRIETSNLIREYLERVIGYRHDFLEANPSLTVDEGAVQFIGRCTYADHTEGVAYHVIPRNGWYRFHPPINRHIDQLHVYMRGLGADYGQLVYVSMGDVTDVRTWPPAEEGDPFLTFDEGRYCQIVMRAKAIKEHLVSADLESGPVSVPFPKCDCHLCETETVPEGAEMSTAPDEKQGADRDENNVGMTYSPVPILATDSLDGCETTPLNTDGYHVPAALREYDIWVTWDCRQKFPRAP